ncbi:hypothetical protein ElyMa_003728200, partial [Elysia marginata]
VVVVVVVVVVLVVVVLVVVVLVVVVLEALGLCVSVCHENEKHTGDAHCGKCQYTCTDIPNLRAYGNCQAQRATELCGADLGAVYRALNDAYVMYCPEGKLYTRVVYNSVCSY